MPEPAHILAEAKRLEADRPRSKLDPYAEVVWELRRKRKRLCSIAAFLHQHGVRVGKSTVARWLKNHPIPRPDTPAASQPLPGKAASPEDHDRARRFFNSTAEEP